MAGAILGLAFLAWRAEAAALPADASVCRGPAPAPKVCLWLRQAEEELAQGHAPEAAAFGWRAERELARVRDGPALPPTEAATLHGLARWVRAEALARGRRTDEAIAVFSEIERTGPPALRDAAGLRIADLRVEAGQAAAAHARYEALLPRGALEREALAASALRAADAAVAAKDPKAARRWLEVARAQALEGTDEALLAAARLELAAAAGPPAEGSALRRAAGSPRPDVSREGRALLAQALLDAGDASTALPLLEKLLAEGVSPRLAPSVRAALARALAVRAGEARDEAGCRALVTSIGPRLPRLARSAGDRKSLDVLAACQDRLGLVANAARLRQRIAREFGSTPEAQGAPVERIEAPARGAPAPITGEIDAVAAGQLADAGRTALRARAALAK